MIWTCKQCGKLANNVAPFSVITCSCGYVDRRQNETQSHVEQDTLVPPGVLRRGANYMRAWIKWTKKGRPVRDEAEVKRLREICSACELYNGKVCTHKKCGCNVVKPTVFGDKLKWSTEHCPIGKW